MSTPISVLALAAGRGSRFSNDHRYKHTHKILIPILDSPMISLSLGNTTNNLVPVEFDLIVVISDQIPLSADEIRTLIETRAGVSPIVVTQEGYVSGAGLSSLYAKSLINTNTGLFLVNVDQHVVGNYGVPIQSCMSDATLDGIIFCFTSNEDRYSYVTVDDSMIATSMVEKQVVSELASAGLCFWKKSEEYYKYLALVEADIEDELYISAVQNAAIKNGLKFKVEMVDKFTDLGTPKDLETLEEKWKSFLE